MCTIFVNKINIFCATVCLIDLFLSKQKVWAAPIYVTNWRNTILSTNNKKCIEKYTEYFNQFKTSFLEF